jgi:hypothetical protein
MKAIVEQKEHRGAAFLESWEVDFLRSGREPESGHLYLFSLLYELNDWRRRWKTAEAQIVAEWRRQHPAARPVPWIRYLTRIGYISGALGEELCGDGRSPVALSA